MSFRPDSGRPCRIPFGVTLLELLVSLTVFSLIALTVYSGLRLGARSWDAGEEHADAADELRLVGEFLRRNLAKARPLLVREDGRWKLLFEGAETRLMFAAEMPPHLGVGGLYQVTLEVEEDGEMRRLRMSRRLMHPDLDPEDQTLPAGIRDEAVLIDALEEARFGYFGARSRDAAPGWHDRWEEAVELPELVRLQVSIGEDVDWPELIVRPRIDSRSYDTAGFAGKPPDDVAQGAEQETGPEGTVPEDADEAFAAEDDPLANEADGER